MTKDASQAGGFFIGG